MTKKDFFRILIKIFGLYSLVTAMFTVLPNSFSTVFYDLDAYGILHVLLLLIMVVFLYTLLIKNPDKVIRLLKLEEGFDDDYIKFENLNSENIIKLGLIVIGGFLLIDNIPYFLSHTYVAFKSDVSGSEINPTENIYWATSFLNIIVGYILVTYFKKLSKILNEKKEGN